MATGLIKQVTNNSGTGYCKMPDGTLICWGKVNITRASEAMASESVTFPVAFVNSSAVSISLTLASANNTILTQYNVGVSAVLTTGFTLNLGSSGTSEGTSMVHWHAVGRWR